MSYKDGGLYKKFTVLDKEGKEVEEFTFTLIPSRDDYAVEAIIVYAASVSKENKELAIQLMKQMEPLVIRKSYLELLHRFAKATFALTGRMMDEVGQ